MEPLNRNNFEDEWQRAFENASVSPPADMWDKIERELDRKKRRPFIFFLRPSGIAAGVAAALVLVLGGMWFLGKSNLTTETVISQNIPQTKQSDATQSTQTVIQADKNPAPSNDVLALAEANKVGVLQNSTTKNRISIKGNPNISDNVFENNSLATVAKVELKNNKEVALSIPQKITQNTYNQQVADNINNLITKTESKNTLVELHTLQSKGFTYFGSRYTLVRNKLAFAAEVNETEKIASNDSKFWLGIQSGVSPYDPNMKLGGLNTYALEAADAFATASSASPSSPNLGSNPTGNKQGNVVVSQPQNAIKSGVSFNTGFAFGYKIAKKWNIESGLRYLRGNSTLNSNTYAFQQSGYVNTFFADYLLQNSSSKVYTSAAPINTVVADVSQFDNRYEYLMIPMQLGYEIGLSKKLGLNLLAGISADIFLQNTITNDNSFVQEESIINNANKIYKPLNISGLGGMRASYLISKHWQASIGSSYQHALFSGINSSTNLQMQPRMFGINYGVNYRF
jgi:hypothetical protein